MGVISVSRSLCHPAGYPSAPCPALGSRSACSRVTVQAWTFGAVLNAIRSCVSHSLSELGPARGTLTPGKACTCQAPPACLQLCRRRNCHVFRSVQVQYAVCSNAEGSNGSGGSGGRGRGAGCGLPAAASEHCNGASAALLHRPVPSSHWQRPGMRCPVGCGPALPSQRDPAEGVSSTVCSLLTISARRAHLSARCLSCISSSMTFPSTAPRSACCTCSISWSPTCGGEAMPHAVQVNCPQLNCRYCNC